MKTQKETPGNVEQHDQNLGQDAEQYDKYQSLSFDKLEAYKKKMEDLIIEISEELMSGKLPNLAKEEAATNILNYYKKNLENQ